MHEHFYNVAYVFYDNGVAKTQGSCLLRTSKVPTLDSVKAHIRTYFLNNPTAIITISHVSSISKEVYLKLGGDPNAPILKESW